MAEPSVGHLIADPASRPTRATGTAWVAVAIGSGRLLRRLILLPHQELSVDNGYDGTEGTIAADATGHYILIATAGPHGDGEIFRWAARTRHLVMVAAGALRAAWG